MEFVGNNIKIISLDYKTNFKGEIISEEFIDSYDEIIELSITELKKEAPKIYSYLVLDNDGNEVGIISFKIISMLNEYKLASLHITGSNKTLIIEALEILLKWQILENSMIKIISNVKKNSYLEFILQHLGFINNKEVNGLIEYKITKPLYLKG